MANSPDDKLKQQVIEKISSSSSILVTVSSDPSVDALSAAIGLTSMINKLGKHATAIFSGAVPPAITFLDPDKTFENTPDSLRDFIIALNKEKADHLRYKIEGDVVKIFITPYRTTISSEDLEFSQGDYNVELVLALGVTSQNNLDTALSAHGRILHDATVISLSNGTQTSQLGNIDWHEPSASGLSEMVYSLSEILKPDKSLIDQQVATALLTGIVAATDRFSNNLTSAQVMTMAAQLMAAGADQQLIAAKLQESHEISAAPAPIASVDQASTVPDAGEISEGSEIDLKSAGSTLPPEPAPVVVSEPISTPEPAPAVDLNTQDTTTTQSTLAPEQPASPVLSADPTVEPTIPDSSTSTLPPNTQAPLMGEPELGGTLSATTQQAADQALQEAREHASQSALKHSYLGQEPERTAPINGADQTASAPSVDVFAQPPGSVAAPALPPQPQITPPTDLSSLPLPPTPPPVPDLVAPPPASPPERLGDIFGAPAAQPQPSVAPQPSDNSQFKIPGA